MPNQQVMQTMWARMLGGGAVLLLACGPAVPKDPATGGGGGGGGGGGEVAGDEGGGGEVGPDEGGEGGGDEGGPDEGGGGQGGAPASDGAMAQAFLAAHNQYRARHCAPPLAWSAELAKVAQGWADALRADGCGFEHSRTRYGENLAAGTSGALDPTSTTEMWYREVDAFDFARPTFAMDTGHFTQLVWAGTTQLGCGVSTCNGLDIYVCNYDPPGNVEGGYRANVKPTGCR